MRRLTRVVLTSVAVLVAVGGAAPAGAQEPPSSPGPTTATEGSLGGQVVRGTLGYDDEEGEEVPVEGIAVTVASQDGAFSRRATTDEDGRFAVPVPGPGSYVATIDPDSIPDDLSLRDEERTELSFDLGPGQSRSVLFPLVSGEGGQGSDPFVDRFLRLGVEGVKFGLIIAICAVGLSLIFGTTGLTNFAHGEMVTYGALIAYLFNVTIGWPMLVAGPLAVAVGVATGFLIDRAFWRPLHRRGTGLVAMLVITIGLGLLIRYVFLYQFQGRTRTYADYQLQRQGLDLGPVTIVPRDLATIGLSTVVLVLVAVFLQRTRVGKAMRAVADNRDLAESSGIDVERVVGYVWASGAGLAALGGILLGLSEQVSWVMGFQLLLLMFAGVTLGGLGTAYGALVGGLVVGLFVQLSTLWIAPELKNVGALVILIVVLLVRPQGILGQPERVG